MDWRTVVREVMRGAPGPLRALFIVTVLALSAVPATTGAGEVADLRRPTMPVADLEASVAFFVEVLGFSESGRAIYNSPVLRAAIGAAPDADITVVALSDLNQEGALVLVSAPGLEIDTAANTRNATTLAFSVDDLDAVYERARAAGYRFIMTPEQAAAAENYPPEKEMILLEPSGHRLIIVQPPPES